MNYSTNQKSTSQTSLFYLSEELIKNREKVFLGGGEKKRAKHKSKGKMTARERVDYLLDSPKEAIEIGTFAGEGGLAQRQDMRGCCWRKIPFPCG